VLAAWLGGVQPIQAATIYVADGGDLQQALNAAQPGDVILLAQGAEFS
jgi:nitrous oxidase accessory protein NosD